ncbi:sensor histidine kinase [Bizionia psychrotolerans]|uniref:sensor histidine kinase n=1 Tax=Bizionia psychrotolerans TaxID=1492901 RepID=UPI0018CF3979|nr:sensor histidine kinase [Bizionia psychrotolerans]
MSLLRDNQKVKCLEVALEALEFAKEHNLLIKQLNYAITIQGLYEENKNFEKANEYSKLILKLQNDYNLIIQDKFLLDLKEKYKLAEKENEIKINQLEIENKNRALASNKTNLYVSIGLLLAAIGLTLLIGYFLKKEQKSNKELQKLSQENEFLLSEANHRINNNLQLVVILISDQLKKTSEENKFLLKNILTKVEAISTLHKHLYKNEDKQKLELHYYLNDVKISFFDVFKDNNIETNFSIDAVEIPTDYAMYFGLLLTELCINSIKHAFEKQGSKEINFELSHNNNMLYFHYSDNGTTANNKTIVPKLIDKLCRQIKVDYRIDTSNGFKFSIEQKLNNE